MTSYNLAEYDANIINVCIKNIMKPQISFEFFPPKTIEEEAKLLQLAQTLSQHQPHYFSVTYGACGTTQQTTTRVVESLHQHTSIAIAPHLTCIGAEHHAIEALLKQYQSQNIKRIVALRGDLPNNMTHNNSPLQYADHLVKFIRKTTGDHFHIAVAAYPEGHPEASSIQDDIQNLQRKVQAGANSIITQLFYNPDAYFYFVERCHKIGIHVPIIPGIMPISSLKNLQRFATRCGAEVPLWIQKHLEGLTEDSAGSAEFCTEVVGRLCTTLLKGGAPALHFYTLNQLTATTNILKSIR